MKHHMQNLTTISGSPLTTKPQHQVPAAFGLALLEGTWPSYQPCIQVAITPTLSYLVEQPSAGTKPSPRAPMQQFESITAQDDPYPECNHS